LFQFQKDEAIVLIDHDGVDLYWEKHVRQHRYQLVTINNKASWIICCIYAR